MTSSCFLVLMSWPGYVGFRMAPLNQKSAYRCHSARHTIGAAFKVRSHTGKPRYPSSLKRNSNSLNCPNDYSTLEVRFPLFRSPSSAKALHSSLWITRSLHSHTLIPYGLLQFVYAYFSRTPTLSD